MKEPACGLRDNQLVDLPTKVLLYGAGSLGRLALHFCELTGIEVVAFIDSNAEVLSKIVSNHYDKSYSIYKPEVVEINEDFRKIPIYVAIATLPYDPIKSFLQTLGWKYIEPFYKLTEKVNKSHPLNNGWQVNSLSNEEQNTIESIKQNLEDQTSINHYEAFIAWHNGYKEISEVNPTISHKSRYVIDPLKIYLRRNPHCMVDIGAHTGGSVERLLEAGIKFKEYHLFEPDHTNLFHLRRFVESSNINHEDIYLYSYILGQSSKNVLFHKGLGYSSQVSISGSSRRYQYALDTLMLKPTFIKIHTEGTELNIIKGSCKTIASSRPALALSVYHNSDGIYKTIQYLINTMSSYKIYFRLHDFQGTGAFVYCIPE